MGYQHLLSQTLPCLIQVFPLSGLGCEPKSYVVEDSQEWATPREPVLFESYNLVLLPILGLIKWKHKTWNKNSYVGTQVPSGGRSSKAAQLRSAQAPATCPAGWATGATLDIAVGVGDAERVAAVLNPGPWSRDGRQPAVPQGRVELLKAPQRLEDRIQHPGQQGHAPGKPRAISQSQTHHEGQLPGPRN